MEAATVTPRVYWAQDSDWLWLTIDVVDVANEAYELGEKRVVFRGVRGGDGAACGVELELGGEIEPEKSLVKVGARDVFLSLKKKEAGFWPFLLEAKEKAPFLFIDFARWRDEDEEGGDGEAFDYSKYASAMQGEGGSEDESEGEE